MNRKLGGSVKPLGSSPGGFSFQPYYGCLYWRHSDPRRSAGTHAIYFEHVLWNVPFLAHYTREKHIRFAGERCAREQLAYSPAERFQINRRDYVRTPKCLHQLG